MFVSFISLLHNIIMANHKYTLPRHTNLARQASRVGAFLVDIAIGLALTLGFFFGCFRLAFRPITKPCEDLIRKEEINSGLYFENSDGDPQRVSGEEKYDKFLETLEYYYFHYLTGENIKEGLEPCKEKREGITVAWYNENVLGISESNPDAVFTYVKSGEEADKSQIGVPKEDVSEDVVSKYVQEQYVYALTEDFNYIGYIYKAGSKAMFFHGLAFTLAGFIGFGIAYVLIPWLMKNGQTLGKKVYKIGLATSDGYKFHNVQLLMRFMPFAVCDAVLFLLIQVNLYLVLLVYLIIFLVSFAVAMASPKKMALHDYTARTIVVDLQSSTLFENQIKEEQYLLKEDNILDDIPEATGEEPELKYEK